MGEIIIGSYKKGQTVLVIEDTVTLATSILQTVKTLRDTKLKVEDTLAIVARNPQGIKNLETKGIKLTYFMTLEELINFGVELGYINKSQFKLAQQELDEVGKVF